MRQKREAKLYHQIFKDGGNMDSFIQKLKDKLLKPDASDLERIERWIREIDEADKARESYPMQAPFKLIKKDSVIV